MCIAAYDPKFLSDSQDDLHTDLKYYDEYIIYIKIHLSLTLLTNASQMQIFYNSIVFLLNLAKLAERKRFIKKKI